MTLLVLTYHRAHAGPDGNSPAMLDAHFEWIAANSVNVVPGDPLPAGGLATCLMFDGAFYDFAAMVFPLLEKHDLRAVLAVAPGFIRDRTTAPGPERLDVPSEAAYRAPNSAAFCTWCELETLVRTGRVTVAANGYTHARLDGPESDLETEVHVPRTLLASRLSTEVDSFVFPFGRYSRRAVAEARSGYRFAFGNSGASNRHWEHRVIRRICADRLPSPAAPFESGRLALFRARALWQALRRK